MYQYATHPLFKLTTLFSFKQKHNSQKLAPPWLNSWTHHSLNDFCCRRFLRCHFLCRDGRLFWQRRGCLFVTMKRWIFAGYRMVESLREAVCVAFHFDKKKPSHPEKIAHQNKPMEKRWRKTNQPVYDQILLETNITNRNIWRFKGWISYIGCWTMMWISWPNGIIFQIREFPVQKAIWGKSVVWGRELIWPNVNEWVS